MLFGMYSFFVHRTKLDFYDKAIEFMDDDGERRIL